MINFNLTLEQKELKNMINRFVEEEIRPNAVQYDNKQNLSERIAWPLIEKALKLGIGSAKIPSEYGGIGLSNLDIMIITEELSRGDAGFAATILANVHCSHPILHFGNDEQKKFYFNEMINNSNKPYLLSLAFAEPQAGADSMSPDPAVGIQLFAKADGDNYILNGTKCFITNGGIADTYLVWARTDKCLGAKQGGLSVFLVSKNTHGLSIGRIEDKLGQRLSQQTELIFDNCKIPKKNLLGQEGMGFSINSDLFPLTFTSVGAIGIGIARAAFEYAYSYAKSRIQGGTQIINHQAINHKLSNILMMIEATRNLVYKSAWHIDNDQPNPSLASMCKLMGSELAQRATKDALDIYGSYGFSKEYPVEKLYRDASVLSIYYSGNEIHRTKIIDIFRNNDQINEL